MQAVIFAAGEGKRMRPLTEHTPKPLLRVCGKPLLSYTLECLPSSVTEIILIVGYKDEQLRSYIEQEHKNLPVTFVKQETVGGTAAALLLAKPHLSPGRFLTMCADDIYSRRDIERLLSHERAVLLAHAADPARFGVVSLNERNEVVEIEEKPEHPKSDLVSIGVYLLDEKIFAYEAPVHPNGERYLPDMVAAAAREWPIVGVESEFWLQIGYPEDIAKAEEALCSRKDPLLVYSTNHSS